MPKTKFTHITNTEIPAGSLIVAPLSQEMLDKTQGLQQAYSDEFGRSHLWLPEVGELYVAFAKIVVPRNKELGASISERVRVTKSPAAHALRQVVDISKGDYTFEVKASFDQVEASKESIVIKSSEDGRMNQLRNLFKALAEARLPLDEPSPLAGVNITSVRFLSELPLSDIEAFSAVTIQRYFSPIKMTFGSLRLVQEARVGGQGPKVLEEFPLPK